MSRKEAGTKDTGEYTTKKGSSQTPALCSPPPIWDAAGWLTGSPFSSQITLANILKSVKACNRHQPSVSGCPRWDSKPRQPSRFSSPYRPSSALGAGRITAAGPGYLEGRATQKRSCTGEPAGASCSGESCSRGCCQLALSSHEGLRKQPREEKTLLRFCACYLKRPRLLQCALFSPTFTHIQSILNQSALVAL